MIRAILSILVPVGLAIAAQGYFEADLRYLVIVAVWFAATVPAGELIGRYLAKFEPEQYEQKGLEKAGRVIGWLERTLVLVFYLGGSLEAIAFLVVAKSLYRFGDLRRGHRRPNESGEGHRPGAGSNGAFSISEYIILGSLLSYTVGILAGVSVDVILENLAPAPGLFGG